MASGSLSTTVPNSLGHVLQLTDNTFGPAIAEGPLFVKMFAPWQVLSFLRAFTSKSFENCLTTISILLRCGHCKKLLPSETGPNISTDLSIPETRPSSMA